ncbi:MAG: glycosyltransferase [Methanobrevibacter sp.]|jgi:glycosyltransferase involved in cell wall biosynthesis|nr:glycosyltransferase [Methanobrevibacter sp.]
MNILHIVSSFYPCLSAGGVVNASYQIAKKQVEKGHNVSVFTTDSCKNRLRFNDSENNSENNNENNNEIYSKIFNVKGRHSNEKYSNGRYNVNIDGINVHYFRNISNKLKNSFLIDTPIFIPYKLKKEIKNFDIIHIHEHRHSLAIVAHHYAKKYKIPYIIQSHGSVLPFFQKESIKKIFDKLWGFNILHDASKAFALTEVEKKQYLKMGIDEEKIAIVPLGVNLKEYSNLPNKGNFRKKYNISPNSKIILFIGRIHKIKGLDLLINSFKLLLEGQSIDDYSDKDNTTNNTNNNSNSNNNISNGNTNINTNTNTNNINNGNNDKNKEDNETIKLVIVGPDDGFLANIQDIINKLDLHKNIIITGPLFKSDKIEALVDCDIFVMPSQYESFTTSGLEAMACYKPLILTENNHIHNWVDNNIGFSSKYEIFDLFNKLKKLLNDTELMKIFGNNGRKLIEEKYNWDKIEEEINSIYKNIIN